MSPLRRDHSDDNGRCQVSVAQIIPSQMQGGDQHRQPRHFNQQKNSPLRQKSQDVTGTLSSTQLDETYQRMKKSADRIAAVLGIQKPNLNESS